MKSMTNQIQRKKTTLVNAIQEKMTGDDIAHAISSPLKSIFKLGTLAKSRTKEVQIDKLQVLEKEPSKFGKHGQRQSAIAMRKSLLMSKLGLKVKHHDTLTTENLPVKKTSSNFDDELEDGDIKHGSIQEEEEKDSIFTEQENMPEAPSL